MWWKWVWKAVTLFRRVPTRRERAELYLQLMRTHLERARELRREESFTAVALWTVVALFGGFLMERATPDYASVETMKWIGVAVTALFGVWQGASQHAQAAEQASASNFRRKALAVLGQIGERPLSFSPVLAAFRLHREAGD